MFNNNRHQDTPLETPVKTGMFNNARGSGGKYFKSQNTSVTRASTNWFSNQNTESKMGNGNSAAKISSGFFNKKQKVDAKLLEQELENEHR
jgi:hypothetical protein